MEKLIICGGKPLRGTVEIHGAKNSVLPILAACVLCPQRCVITRCPDILDVAAAVEILQSLGCTAERVGGSAVVDAGCATETSVSGKLMERMRASVIFLGPLLGRFGEAELSLPGGCSLGKRPIDYHIAALGALGVRLQEQGNRLYFSWPEPRGGEVTLPFPSVGATENVILAATAVSQCVTLYNAAQEPEITDLCNFLTAMGAEISGAGTDTIYIHGGKPLHGVTYTVMPDRIETATYLAMTAACGGEILLKNAKAEHLKPVISTLKKAGCEIKTEEKNIYLKSAAPLHGVGLVETEAYPGFPTDAQAPLMAALLRAEGESLFRETVFQSRFHHVKQLKKFGADIELSESHALVRGTAVLQNTRAEATDLRGGAGVLIAALQAEGKSLIENAQYIRRGYADLEQNLSSLGAAVYHEEPTIG